MPNLKIAIRVFNLCLLMLGVFQNPVLAQGCPGTCTECKPDALAVCGGGCVASLSCSNKDCSCSYSCRAGCHPGSPSGVLLEESIFTPHLQLVSDVGEHYSSSPTVHLNVVEQSAVPLALSDLTIQNEPGRELSQLAMKIKNQSTSPLREVSVMVVFLSPTNESLGGETFCEHLDTNPNEEKTLRVPLRHYVETGQRVWIAFRKFKTDAQSWSSEGEEINKSIRQHDAPPAD